MQAAIDEVGREFFRVAPFPGSVSLQPGSRLEFVVMLARQLDCLRCIPRKEVEEFAKACCVPAKVRRKLPEDGTELLTQGENAEAKKLASGMRTWCSFSYA